MKRVHYYMLIFRGEEEIEVFKEFRKLAKSKGRTFKGLLLKLMKAYLKNRRIEK